MTQLAQEHLDWLRENDRLVDIPEYERVYRVLDVISENRLADAVSTFGAMPTGKAADAWKPFARDNWRDYSKEVLRLVPNADQLLIADLESRLLPGQKKTLDVVAPRFTSDQARFLDSVDKFKRTGCGAGNGTGKSDGVAVAARYLYDKGYKVIILANTYDQVFDVVFAYIRTQHVGAVDGSGGYLYPKAMRMEYSPEHVLQGLATDTKVGEQQVKGLSGRHFGKVAVIIDEAQGAAKATLETAENICTGDEDKIIVIYNPTDPGCAVREAMGVLLKDGTPLWNEVQISGENHPNVVYGRTIIPGAVTREFIAAKLAIGVTRDSAIYRASVLGIWPDDSPDALIEEEWILAAQARGKVPRPDDYRGKALGVDVAAEGKDLTNAWGVSRAKAFMPMLTDPAILAKYPKVRRGAAWHVNRNIIACEQLIYAILNSDPEFRHVGIDDTGVGQGVRANLAENSKKHFPKYLEYRRTGPKDVSRIQFEIESQAGWSGFTFGAAPHEPADDRFVNVKSQILWFLREQLQAGAFDLPSDEELRSYGLPEDSNLVKELKRCIYGVSAEKKLMVMDKRGAMAPTLTMKAQAKQLPTNSPDLLHALAMACWVYFKVLRPGVAPIKNTVELHAIQRKRQVDNMIADRRKLLGGPKSHRRGAFPWMKR